MKKNKWGIILAVLLVIWSVLSVVGYAEGISESELYAQAAVLMDAESGRVLYGKNEEQVLAMASTTKIMTCILALENAQLTDMVEVSSYAAGMPQVKLGIRKGETYLLRDLLYSLMLESHNDVAVAIAEHIGSKILETEQSSQSASGVFSEGSGPNSPADFTEEESRQAVAAFADLMNEKAAELGCRNTWFITPNGLDAEESVQQENGEYMEKFHSTTAAELAQIMAYCVLQSSESERFLEITQASTYTFSGENGRTFACYNHNAFLNMMSGAISGKTGFTNRAGYCYVGALERDGRTFVVALLACGWPYNKNYKWSDTRKLMEYGVENYYYRSFLDEETIFDKKWLEPILVLNGQPDVLGENAYVQVEVKTEGYKNNTGHTSIGSTGGLEAQQELGLNTQLDGLLMKAGEEIAVEYKQQEYLQAPVEEGTVVGHVSYKVDGITYRTEEIVTVEGVERISLRWCVEQILDRFLVME